MLGLECTNAFNYMSEPEAVGVTQRTAERSWKTIASRVHHVHVGCLLDNSLGYDSRCFID